MKTLALLFITMTLLTSCGKTPTANVKISGSFALTGDSFSGGAVLLASTIIDGRLETFSIPMENDSISYDFPVGKYNLMTLGWDGLNALTGNIYCDAKEAFVVDSDIEISFVLTQLSNPILATHNCRSFIEGEIVQLSTTKICSENNPTGLCADSTSYVRAGSDRDMSIRYGILPHQGAPIFTHPTFFAAPPTTLKTSNCILNADITPVTQGNLSDIAEFNFTNNGPLALPQRLLKGLRLPLSFTIYESNSSLIVTDCSEEFFAGAGILGNSLGEVDGLGTQHHDVGSNFIYRIPTQPYELTTVDQSGVSITQGSIHTYTITNIGEKAIRFGLYDNQANKVYLDYAFPDDLICLPAQSCSVNILGNLAGSGVLTIEAYDLDTNQKVNDLSQDVAYVVN